MLWDDGTIVSNNDQTLVCFLSLVTHPCIVTVLSGTRCRPSTIRAWIAARAPATTHRRPTRRPVGGASAWAEVDRRSTRQPMRGHRDSRDSARKNQRKCPLAALHLVVNLWCTCTYMYMGQRMYMYRVLLFSTFFILKYTVCTVAFSSQLDFQQRVVHLPSVYIKHSSRDLSLVTGCHYTRWITS